MKKFIKKIIPIPVLNKLRRMINGKKLPYFIKVYDVISNNHFFLFLRKDSYMESIIHDTGLYGEWEQESLRLWAHLSKTSSVIIDIGANTGIYSILSAINNKSAAIIAVEPININYEVLKKNIKKNRLKNVSTTKVAISNKDGQAKMYMLKDRLNYMTSIDLDRYKDSPWFPDNPEVVEVEVPVLSFSTFYRQHNLGPIDLVKIDVEEHEYEVLESMFPLIEKFKPNMLIEIIGEERAKKIDELLLPLKYKVIAIYENKPSQVVTHLWDNEHHNFLFCNDQTFEKIKSVLDLSN